MHESLTEVSGAVEIDDLALQRIEAGVERPAEDILMLLIAHYNMAEPEAVQLWELAGYNGTPELLHDPTEELAKATQKAVVMMLSLDARSVYSDGLDIHCNQAGVTLTFTQAAGQTKPVAVSRVGMSYEQAKRVAQVLNQALAQAENMRKPKQLPPPSTPNA